jgi:hypothetical protein
MRNDATWCARVAPTGNGVALESLNFPGRLMRHRNAQVWLSTGTGLGTDFESATSFANDATWTNASPWSTGTATPTPTATPVVTPTPTVTPRVTATPTNTPRPTPTPGGTPSGTNVALNKAATGSTACNVNEGPAKAVNGSVSGGNTDKFCSTVAPRFLQVDLGAAFNVNGFIVRHAAAGGEAAAMNTRDFNIQTSPDNATWTTVVTVTANAANITTHAIAARSARYARLNITTPTQTTDGAARIYEFEVYGTAGGATPTPTATPAPTATPTSGGAAAWAPNVFYAVGSLATYGGATYRCIQAHTSLVGWEPPNAPSLWVLQ